MKDENEEKGDVVYIEPKLTFIEKIVAMLTQEIKIYKRGYTKKDGG